MIALGIAAIAMLAYAYGYWTGRCNKTNPCPKCSFHVNEQRVERIAAEHERVEEAKRQAILRHDYEHEGGYDCADDSCARNKKRVD